MCSDIKHVYADSWPTLWRVSPRLWRVGRQLHNAHTHTLIVEELVLESALESAHYSRPILQKSVCGYGPLQLKGFAARDQLHLFHMLGSKVTPDGDIDLLLHI